jgi:FemAB-related protein (PEP-CTERM system-associated)
MTDHESTKSAGEVSVRRAESTDRVAWNEYVLAHPQATFFHRFEWIDVIGQAFGHRGRSLLAFRGGRIAGVLPLTEVKSFLFGHSLVSNPFCVYGGVLADDGDVDQALSRAAVVQAESLGVSHLELRSPQPSTREWVTKDLYVTFRRNISPDHEENLKAIPRKQRAEVRKGIKLGLSSRVDADASNIYRVYSESLRNLGTPVFSRKYLDILMKTFGNDCEVTSILHQGQVVASVLSFYFRGEVLPYYGGGLRSARGLSANDFMYWDVMQRAVARGCTVFDFGRSKRGTGSYDFKRHWGFEETPLHYEYYLVRSREMPDLSPMNPKYRLMIETWKRMPLWCSQLVGPPLARHLG